ncbi:MAG: dihydrofolate reductase family protein [Ignavibacteriales bacterium]|nr:dihydrofolate reductase family protein [Ignavibacteriales bacterium]
MKKLKLQMQTTINGFVGGPNGELDWMMWDWTDDIKDYVTNLTDSVDTILLGRKMADGFITHWSDIVKNKQGTEEYPFAKKMVDYHKVVFTKTLDKSTWDNTVLAKGNVVEEVNKLKQQDGNDLPAGQAGIIVYGGAEFVSALVKENLIDEYYLFVNPTALKTGLTIFNTLPEMMKLKLTNSTTFKCGINLLKYEKM